MSQRHEQVGHESGRLFELLLVRPIAGEAVLDPVGELQHREGGHEVAAELDVAELTESVDEVLEIGFERGVPGGRGDVVRDGLAVELPCLGDGVEEDDGLVESPAALSFDGRWHPGV